MSNRLSVIASWRRALWRWHLWAGVIIAPFLTFISITGALYAFAPQLEPALSKDLYFHAKSETGEKDPSIDKMLESIHAKYPEYNVEALDIHKDPERNWQFRIHNESEDKRLSAFFNPSSGEFVGTKDPQAGIMQFVLRLHRTLLAGEAGRFMTEAATSWGIVTLLTGLCMWWPKVWAKLAGVWSISRDKSNRLNKRDRHAIIGIYVFPLALVLMTSGLLFTPVWGKIWLAGNALTGGLPDFYLNPPQSTTSGAEPIELDTALAIAYETGDYTGLSVRMVIPHDQDDAIHIHSELKDAAFHFESVFVDQNSGAVLSYSTDKDFNIRTILTLLFYPIHTGTIFGWPTQLLAMLAAIMISMLSLSGLALWWHRGRRFSTPEAAMPKTASIAATVFAIALPLVGVSLVLVFIIERIGRLFRRCQGPKPKRLSSS